MEIPFGAAVAQENRRGRPNGFFRAVIRPYAAVPIIAGFVSFLKPEIPFFSHWGAACIKPRARASGAMTQALGTQKLYIQRPVTLWILAHHLCTMDVFAILFYHD